MFRVPLVTFLYRFQIRKTARFRMMSMNSLAVSMTRLTLSTGVGGVLQSVSICADDQLAAAPSTETDVQCHIEMSLVPNQRIVLV